MRGIHSSAEHPPLRRPTLLGMPPCPRLPAIRMSREETYHPCSHKQTISSAGCLTQFVPAAQRAQRDVRQACREAALPVVCAAGRGRAW